MAVVALEYLGDLGVGDGGDVELYQLALERAHDLFHASFGNVVGLVDLAGDVGVNVEANALLLEPAYVVRGLVDKSAEQARVERLVRIVHCELQDRVGRDVQQLLFLYVGARGQHAVREHGVAARGVALFDNHGVDAFLPRLGRCR